MDRIVTLTMNPTIDASTNVDRVVDEKKLRCSEPVREPGGGGLNVSRAIRKLGGDALALHTSGGLTGELLEKLLQEEGVRGLPIRTSGLTREGLMVMERSTNRQYRFNMPGPSLTKEEVASCREAVLRLEPVPQYLVASGSLPPGAPDDFYADLSREATARGTRVIVDTSNKALRAIADHGKCFLLKPNFHELEVLVGKKLAGEDEVVKAARELILAGATEVVLVSLGAGGAVAVTAREKLHIASPTVPIRSRVGAGDSSVAGTVLSLARGFPLIEAMRFGVASGAAAVMTDGSELCRREDAERLYEGMKLEAEAPRGN